jgi:hypothetical protein
MKNGIASRVNEVVEAYMRWATIVRMSDCPITRNVTTAVNPMLTATGTPRRIRPINAVKITRVVILHQSTVMRNYLWEQRPSVLAGENRMGAFYYFGYH